MNAFMKTPCILLCVGFCGGGKTVAITYTIKTLKAFDFVVVLSSTSEFNGDYDFLKDMPGVSSRIYNASNCNDMFAKIMKIQEIAKKKGDMKRVCIVCDDVMGVLSNSKVFAKLASTYRHFNISIFITTQFVNNSTTYIRELANYVFVFDQRTDQSRKAIHQSYFGDTGTFSQFKELFAGLKPYQFFFIDRPGKKRFKFLVPYEKDEKSVKLPEIGQKQVKNVKNDEIRENTKKSAKFDEKAEFMANFD